MRGIADFLSKKPVLNTQGELYRQIDPMIGISSSLFYPIYARVVRELSPNEDVSENLARYAIIMASEKGATVGKKTNDISWIVSSDLYKEALKYLQDGYDLFSPPVEKKGLFGTKTIHAQVPQNCSAAVIKTIQILSDSINSMNQRTEKRLLIALTMMRYP